MQEDAPSAAQAGDWTGTLGDGSTGLRLRVRAPNGFDGPVTLYSVDQGGAEIPATAKREGDRVTLDVPAVNGRYEGVLSGDRIAGTWRQGRAMPLTLVRGEAGLVRPQAAALTQAGLTNLRTQAGSPALTAAAQRGGRPAVLMADGVRTVDGPASVTTQDRWHVGSITKSMTATLIGRLVEAGVLRWDDTIGATLGASIREIHAGYRDATLLHLLTHRSGLEANLPMGRFMAFRSSPDPLPVQRLAYARQALSRAPKSALGAKEEYSNSGYVVAGAMLEVKTGQPWEALMRAHVFEPLGMVGAGFGAPGAAGAVDEPIGHSKALLGERRLAHPVGGSAYTDNPAVLGPAGTVHARLSDMLAYLAAHRDRTAFLQPQTWDRLHTPLFGGSMALGWVVRPEGLWHNGSNTLWYAEATVSRDTGAIAFAAANDGYLDRSEGAVSAALAGILAAA